MEKTIPLESIGAGLPQFPVSAFDVSFEEAAHSTVLWGLGEDGAVFSSDIHSELQLHPLPDDFVARTVSLDPRGVPWVLARRPGSDAAWLAEYEANRLSWRMQELGFGCRSFAVTEVGGVWVVDDSGQVWHVDTDGQRRLCSEEGRDFARQIAYRQGHRVWVIGAQERFGGFVVYNLPEESGTWFELPAPASASQLSIGPDGVAWTINANGEVWRLHPNGGGSFRECQVFTGCIKCRFGTRDEFGSYVACGPDGVVWAIKKNESSGERRVMHLEDAAEKSFKELPLSIDVKMLAGSSS